MKAPLPLVSVIMPIFNGKPYMEGAIASIADQRYDALEVLVVDDGSTDGVGEVVDKIDRQIKYIRQEHLGPAAARNTGLRNATGALIAFLDVDDRWPAGKLHEQSLLLQKDSSLDYVMGAVRYFEQSVEILSDPPPGAAGQLHLGAGLFRQDVFSQVGFFNEALQHWEDLEWFMRARECDLHFKLNASTALYYRAHPGSHGQQLSIKEAEKQMLQAVHRSTQRRRDASRRGK